MNRVAGHIQFSLPKEFIDETNYTFSADDPRQEFQIDITEITTEYTSAKEFSDDIAGQVLGFLGKSAKITKNEQTIVAGCNAHLFFISVDDSDSAAEIRMAVIRIDDKTYVQLTYKLENDSIDDTIWAKIISSFQIDRKNMSGQANEFTRYNINRFIIDLPDYFAPPCSYSFYNPSSDIRIEVSSSPAGSSKEALAIPEDAEKISLKQEGFQINGKKGVKQSFYVNKPHAGTRSYVAISFVERNGMQCIVITTAPENAMQNIIQLTQEIIYSMAPIIEELRSE